MPTFKHRALACAGALALASALASAAEAQTNTPINGGTGIDGGGSSLLAPPWGQLMGCFNSANTVYNAKGASAVAPRASATTITASPGVTCPAATADVINFDSTGSGTGQLGLFAHDAVIGTNLSSTGAVTSTTSIDFGSANAAGTTELYPSIQYGLSDNSLVGADLAVYDVGTGGTLQTNFNGDTVTIVAPAVYQGMTFTAAGTPHNGGTNSTVYPIPATRYGALVQFPVSIDPVALAYNPTYLSSNGNTYSLQVASPNPDGSGGLKLNAAAYCAIYEGTLTDWGDSRLTALNGGVSLKDPTDTGTSAPILITGRTDSSGTTSIFTRHLAAVCNDAVVWGTAGTTTLPTAVTRLPNFIGRSGDLSTGFALATNPGAIGYLGTAYTLPASMNTGTGLNLNMADLEITSGGFIEPTGPNALISFGSVLPPQSNSDGSFNASDTTSDRRDPTQWVQSTSATAPLAKPPAGDYPIVGTTNFIGYTCYASATSVSDLQQFLTFDGSPTAAQILSNAGLSQLPRQWLFAIQNTFLETNGDASSLKLFFSIAGRRVTNSNCAASGIVGG